MRIALSSELPVRPGILGAAPGPASLGFDLGHRMTPDMSSSARENLSQRAYLRIRASLIHSELHPGQRLVLRPLAAELQLSPTPVREALLRLVSEQALALDERGSAIVPVIGPEEFAEITEIRCDLEGRAAARAALHVSGSQIEQLSAVAAAYGDAERGCDRAAMLASNAELHRLVCRMARAPLILRFLEGIWMRIGPVYALKLREPAMEVGEASASEAHERLLAALRDGNPDGARAAIVDDVRRSAGWLAHGLPQAAPLQAA